MKARALAYFRDLKERTYRKCGEVFEVTEERFEEINRNGVKATGAPLVEAVKVPAKRRAAEKEAE